MTKVKVARLIRKLSRDIKHDVIQVVCRDSMKGLHYYV